MNDDAEQLKLTAPIAGLPVGRRTCPVCFVFGALLITTAPDVTLDCETGCTPAAIRRVLADARA